MMGGRLWTLLRLATTKNNGGVIKDWRGTYQHRWLTTSQNLFSSKQDNDSTNPPSSGTPSSPSSSLGEGKAGEEKVKRTGRRGRGPPSMPGVGNGLPIVPSEHNIRLAEVITIYEKLTKSMSRDTQGVEDEDTEFIFKPSSNYLKYFLEEEADTPLPGEQMDDSAKVLDFSKFRNIEGKNYSYFSAKTGLLQSQSLDALQWEGSSCGPLEKRKQGVKVEAQQPQRPLTSADLILRSKHFCLNIVNPTERDLSFLGSQFHIHDLTLRDIREQGTEEKVEIFKNYTFISLRPYLSDDNTTVANGATKNGEAAPKKTLVHSNWTRNIDLNLLLFPDFAIIIYYGQHWTGFKDMLGFLNLLSSYGNTTLTPDWVLFSTFIELSQDAKYAMKQLEPKILSVKVTENMKKGEDNVISDTEDIANELSTVLRTNFDNEFEIYRINRFIKPKIKILNLIKIKCVHRVKYEVLNVLAGTRKDFEEVGETLGNFGHILERSQDTCLTLANVRQSHEANIMGKSMKRMSEVALLFLPLQAVAAFLGMNVRVPYQDFSTTIPFWTIVGTSSVLVVLLYQISKGALKFASRRTARGSIGVKLKSISHRFK